MQKQILLDVGSSTVKVYEYDKSGLRHIFNRSLKFKEGFSESGVAIEKRKELVELILDLKKENPDAAIKIYATAVFRKLNSHAQKELVDFIFLETGIFFNIISHDLENFYLQKALIGKLEFNKLILVVNIGGGSTELVIMNGDEVIENHNVDLGIGQILEKFNGVNEQHSKHKLNGVVSYVDTLLPNFENEVDIAFYTGGELEYMKRADYALEGNTLMKDSDHPSIIKLNNFQKKNEEVFSKITLEELENMMQEDPKWMHGARACSAIAQAIFEKYSIETIIPSNSNLIDGVVRQEFRSVVLSGSFRKHLEYIVGVRNSLVKKGVNVLSPRFTDPTNPGEEFVVFTGEEGLSPLELERHHLDSIDKSDALIVCDPDGYVGASALIEIGYAQALGKRIIFIEKPEEFMLNILPAQIGL